MGQSWCRLGRRFRRHSLRRQPGLCPAARAAAAGTAPDRASQTVAPSQTVMSPGTQLLLQRLQNGLTPERYLDNLRNDFFQIDADSDGKITQRDAELHSLMEGIQFRTAGLMTVMRYEDTGESKGPNCRARLLRDRETLSPPPSPSGFRRATRRSA
jgi:hypothetical protein